MGIDGYSKRLWKANYDLIYGGSKHNKFNEEIYTIKKLMILELTS